MSNSNAAASTAAAADSTLFGGVRATPSSNTPVTAMAAVELRSAARHSATGVPETSRFGATATKPEVKTAKIAAVIKTNSTWL